MNLSIKFYLIFSFISFLVVLETHSMEHRKRGAVLSAEIIDRLIKSIDNTESNKTTSCHEFMKYMTQSDIPHSLSEQEKIILKLREVLKNENIRGILDDANINYCNKIQNIMSHTEVLNGQRNPLNAMEDKILGLVGYVSLNKKASGSGVLIPIPLPYQNPKYIKWYVLTSAHMIEALPRRDNKTYSVTITTSDNNIYPIRNLKIFKRIGRGVKIINLIPQQKPQHERINKMSLIDMRATLNYDQDGDVALCELDIPQEEHNQISAKILGEHSSSPYWDNKTLIFTLSNGKKCFFHFISEFSEVSELINYVNNNSRNIISPGNCVLGWTYVRYEPQFLQIQERLERLKLYKPGTFININNINKENIYVFSYDAPSIPGMSGSPILLEDKDKNFHFYGLVRGGGLYGESEGVLLQYRLFLQDDGLIGDNF